jgi:hypothetical protein
MSYMNSLKTTPYFDFKYEWLLLENQYYQHRIEYLEEKLKWFFECLCDDAEKISQLEEQNHLMEEEKQKAIWRAAYYKKKLKAGRDSNELSYDDILSFIYHQQKHRIPVDTCRFFLHFMGQDAHTGEKEKKELFEETTEKFGIAQDGDWCMVSMKEYLPFILERYKSQLDPTAKNYIRIGIDGVRVGKKTIVTCIVVTLPFLQSHAHKDVSE